MTELHDWQDEWTTGLIPVIPDNPITIIKLHPHSFLLDAQVRMVRGKHRCANCGHRLTVNGERPKQTRELPVRQWPLEIIDRRRARKA